MILSFMGFLEIADKCPEEEIVLIAESDFNATLEKIPEDFWYRIKDREGFFNSVTKEPLDLGSAARLECMDPDEEVKRFIILGY